MPRYLGSILSVNPPQLANETLKRPMPELPDVEATRRYLISRGLVGRVIAEAEVLWPGALKVPPVEEFRSGTAGREVQGVRRRGKYLLLDLDGSPGKKLVLHLRMTGSLQVLEPGQERPQYTRNLFLLDDGCELCFVDPRKLGMMWLVEDEEEVLGGLGPEPLEAAFTPDVLAHRLSGRAAPVKALLCDQAVVAGVGNIYADEALHLAGIHPLRPGTELTAQDNARLHEAIVMRLTEATEQLAPIMPAGGPPTESERGAETLLVARSKGSACSRCSAAIARVVVRGRSAYFCPRCQQA